MAPIRPPTVEDHFRLLESCIRGIVFEIDADGRYLEVWTHDASLLARPRHEMLGHTITEILGAEGAPFVAMISKVAAEREPLRIEYPMTVIGGPRWFAAEAFPGRREGTVVFLVQDITDRKLLETRVLESERLASIGVVAAGVGHEINNPLAWLMTRLYRLHDEVSAQARGAASPQLAAWTTQLSEGLEAAERVRHIVRDLGSFTGAPEAESSKVDLARAIEQAAKIAGAELRSRAKLTKHFSASPYVFAPEGRVGHVLLNLLLNAAQSIEEGAPDENEIRLELSLDSDGRARLDVVDSGHGIAPEQVSRLFEPFHSRGAGTGLGLSASRRIVDTLAGTLELVSSRPGETRFRLTLPVTAAPEAPSVRTAGGPARPRVLLIDDHPGFLKSLQQVLEPNLEVLAESSARAALALVRGGERFDAIVCDVMMPGFSGVEFYEAVAVEAPALLGRIVFMTGGAHTQKARAFLDAVPNHRIQKPFRAEELEALIAELAAGKTRYH